MLGGFEDNLEHATLQTSVGGRQGGVRGIRDNYRQRHVNRTCPTGTHGVYSLPFQNFDFHRIRIQLTNLAVS